MFDELRARIKANMGMNLSTQEEALLPDESSQQAKEGAWAMKKFLLLGRWNPNKEVGVDANVRTSDKVDSIGNPLN